MDHQTNVPATPDTAEPKTSWFLKRGVLFFATAILILITSVGLAYWQQETKKIDQVPDIEEQQLAIPSDWEKYRSDILGIEFSYPLSWGEPVTQPSKYITDLNTVVSIFDNPDNSYYHSIYLKFSDNEGVSLRIFDDQYPGERYPNARTYSYGYMDNIRSVVASGDICDYKLFFEMPGFPENIKELHTLCENKVKTIFTQKEQKFGGSYGTHYSYLQEDYAFFKLSNSKFPHGLASFRYPHINQREEKLTYEQYINENRDKLDGTDFKIFVNSFKSFAPPNNPILPFVPDPKDSADVTLIKRYYYHIEAEQYESAAQLRAGLINFESFKDSVSNIETASPKNIRLLADGSYEVLINYQLHNTEPQQQRVIYEINNNRLKETFLETIKGKIVNFGDLQAYTSSRGDMNYVVIEQNDKEITVDEAPNDFDKTLDTLVFSNVEFSPKGNFITYVASGYEWASLRVYDIANTRQVIQTAPGPLNSFNKEETLFFTCVSNEFMGSQAAAIYEVPGFDIKLDLIEEYPQIQDYVNYKCTYDDHKNIVTFEFTGKHGSDDQNYDENAIEIFRFDSRTGLVLNP